MIAGGVIGLERKWRHQPAGLRTQMLICMGSTLLMILSIYIPQEYFDLKNGDPGRIAAQVVTGIGFLGAGAILKLGNNIRGMTTAASIWVVAAIGMTIGAGLYILSLCTTVIVLFALLSLERLEQRIFTEFAPKNLVITTDNYQMIPLELIEILRKSGVKMSNIELIHDMENNQSEIRVRVLPQKNHKKMEELFVQIKKVKSLKNIYLS